MNPYNHNGVIPTKPRTGSMHRQTKFSKLNFPTPERENLKVGCISVKGFLIPINKVLEPYKVGIVDLYTFGG